MPSFIIFKLTRSEIIADQFRRNIVTEFQPALFVVCALPETFFLYSSGLCRYIAAASPFRGSIGFGYVSSCGRKDSKMLDKSAPEKKRQHNFIKR